MVMKVQIAYKNMMRTGTNKLLFLGIAFWSSTVLTLDIFFDCLTAAKSMFAIKKLGMIDEIITEIIAVGIT